MLLSSVSLGVNVVGGHLALMWGMTAIGFYYAVAKVAVFDGFRYCYGGLCVVGKGANIQAA